MGTENDQRKVDIRVVENGRKIVTIKEEGKGQKTHLVHSIPPSKEPNRE